MRRTSEDVYRRMQDVSAPSQGTSTRLRAKGHIQIKEAEVDSVADLGAFLDAEMKYYERCREVLMQLKRDWPAG